MENLPEVSRATVASALGYTSIGFWLFAQAPQVVKNARLRSCEGLALPFLCNWLFGDITNFVGCVLTDQLPFQTYLAAYFCVVDFTLLIQFFYYRPTPRPPIYRSTSSYTTSPQQSLLIQTAPLSHSHHVRADSRSQIPPHTRARSSGAVPHHSLPPLSASTTSTVRPGTARASHSAVFPGEASTSKDSSIYRGREPSLPPSSHHLVRQDGSYQAIYEAALDVARAAERAEYHRQHSQSRSRPRNASRRNRVLSNQPSINASVTPEAVEERRSPQILANRSAMFDSFHSDMSVLTDTSGTSSSAQQNARWTTNQSNPALLDRGRSLQRTATATATPVGEEEGGDMISGLPGDGGRGVVQMRETGSRSKSRSVSMARAASGRGSGRRAAGVAFMSLGMLAGWNGLGRGARIRTDSTLGVKGMVLSSRLDNGVSSRPLLHPFTYLPSTYSALSDRHNVDTTYIFIEPPSARDHLPPPVYDPPDFKRIVGRISAWACTTLYLTSRLPQIWKNFERRSVEGLSILLFLFAFCGNTAYVGSIVYNPAASLESPEANQYLLEALPYLLGSGGTLLFDLTIIFQSLLYGSAPPVPQTTIERSSFRKPLFRQRLRLAEEGRGVSASTLGASFGERQPLLSGSMLTVGGGSRRHHRQQQQQLQQGLGPQSVPMGGGDERSRSISADVQLGDGGKWRDGGGVIAGLRRVEMPVVEHHSSGDE